jgi:Leucine-rich repeat (LRR) protein
MKKLLVAVLLLICANSYSQTLEDDRLALIAFYNATNGDNWRPSFVEDRPWIVPGTPGDSPCGWAGVGCENNRVVALYGIEIEGYIPAEIGNLDALKSLMLSENPFSERPLSGQIPEEMAKLTSLEEISLPVGVYDVDNFKMFGNFPALKDISIFMSGPIPEEFTTLKNLESLSISRGTETVKELGGIPSEISRNSH